MVEALANLKGATQHDDTQHDDTQHDDTQHDGTQHNSIVCSAESNKLADYAERH